MRRRKMMEEEPSKNTEKPVEKKEKRKYNLTSSGFRQKIEQNLDKNAKLIKKIKKEITCSRSTERRKAENSF